MSSRLVSHAYTNAIKTTGACMGTTEISNIVPAAAHANIQPLIHPLHIQDFMCRQSNLVDLDPGREGHDATQPFAQFSLIRPLGSGSSGHVYLSKFNNMTDPPYDVAMKFDRQTKLITDPGRWVFLRAERSGEIEVLQSFAAEARIAQLLKEGPLACKRFPVGTPYNISISEYIGTIGFELSQMVRHPGYHYVHKIWDFASHIPCIISEPFQRDLSGITLPMRVIGDKMLQNESDQNRWLNIALQLCQGMQYMHFMGVVHNDIKPANILHSYVHGHDRISIADFSVAHVTHGPFEPTCDILQAAEVLLYLLTPSEFHGENWQITVHAFLSHIKQNTYGNVIIAHFDNMLNRSSTKSFDDILALVGADATVDPFVPYKLYPTHERTNIQPASVGIKRHRGGVS